NARARAAAGGEGITPEAAATLGRLAQQGATQEELLRAAAALGVTKPIKAVTGIAKDPEMEAEKEVRDPTTGEVIGTAPSTRAAATAAEKLAAAKAYEDALHAYADHIRKHGRVMKIGPFASDAAREREQLHSDLVARKRKAMELGVSGANIELDEKSIGGSGVGLDFTPMSSPDVIENMATENQNLTRGRVRSLLRPGQRVGDGSPTRPPSNP